MRRFELVEGTSSKFWEIAREGAVVTVRYGKIGTDGQTSSKDHGAVAKAETEHDKLVREKTKKGYREVTAAAEAAPSPTSAAAHAPAAVEVFAPSGDDDGALALEGDEAKWAIPWRGRPDVPPWPELMPGKLFSQLKLALPNVVQALDQYPGTLSAPAAARRARVAEWASLDAVDLELAANAFSAFSWAKAGLESLTKLFVGLHGLGFALEAMVLGIDRGVCLDRELWPRKAKDGIVPLAEHSADPLVVEQYRDGFLQVAKPALHALRLLVAAAPPDAYSALVSEARALLGRVTTAGAAAIAFVLSEEADLVAAAIRAPILPRSGSAHDFGTKLLLASVRDRALALELLAQRSITVLGGDAHLWTLVSHMGPAAGSVLAAASGREDVGAVVYLRRIHTPASFRALLRFLGNKSEGKAVHKLLLAHPAITRAAIAPVLASPKHPDRPAAEIVAPSVGALAPVAAVAPKPAAAGDVPAVLTSPPWERARAEPKPIALDPILVPIASALKEGEFDAWKDYEAWGIRAAEYRKQVELSRADWQRVIDEDRTNAIELSIMHCAPADMARAAWDALPSGRRLYYPNTWYGMSILAAILRRGAEFIPGLLALVRESPAGADRAPIQEIAKVLAAFDGSAIADVYVEVALTGKKIRAAAEGWAKRHPRTLARSAIPKALAPKPSAGAIALLRTLASSHRGTIDEVAAEYAAASGADVVGALAAVVGSDPLEWVPSKLPKLPEIAAPSALPPIALRSGGSLPESAVAALLTMLAFSSPEAPYAGLAIVREACTPESLRDWAYALYERWMTVGAPPKEMWILHALGHLGDDEIVRRLAPKIRAWPGERAVTRAQEATTMLSLLGTDLALMVLSDLAEGAKFDSLKAAAKAKIDAIAEARGLGVEELADRLVPDLGLDAKGEIELDFGPRSFTVRFDERLEPFVVSQDGTRLDALPKPGKSDDAEKAKASAARLRALKKDLAAIAKSRIGRLEGAMVAGTAWSLADFRAFFVEKPLVRLLTQRLLWRAGETLFRVDESGAFTDVADRAVTLEPKAMVTVVHPISLTKDALERWSQVFADYEVLQPFAQLAREVLPVPASATGADALAIEGVSLPAPKLVFGLERLGWQRGGASDGGAFSDHEKTFRGTELAATITYSGAVGMGYIEDKESLEVESIAFRRSGKAIALADVAPVFVSEVLRDLRLVTSAA